MLSQIQQGVQPGPQGFWQPLQSLKVPRKEQEGPGSKGTQCAGLSAQEQGNDGRGRGALIPGTMPSSVNPAARQGTPAKPKSAKKTIPAEGCAKNQAPTQSASAPVRNAAQAAAEDAPPAADATIRHVEAQANHPGPGNLEHAQAAIERKTQPHRACKTRPIRRADV